MVRHNKKLGLFYDRVSTVNSEQDTSVENQRQLCLDFLERNPEFELAEPVDTYVERVSGKTDLRERYDAMLKRIAMGGDVRYIFVKDLKRLSRSSEVSLEFRTFCKVYDVKLILLGNMGAEEYDPNAEGNRLIFSIESAINEEYVHNQSRLGRLSHKQKMEAKRLNRNNVTFGYKWDEHTKDIIIDEEAAEVIRSVFDLYVFGNLGGSQIARKIAAEYGVIVTNNTVSKWLEESAYVGVFHMNKKGSVLGVGHGQKTKRFTRDKSEWVAVERPDLQIVPTDIYELAQKIRGNRRQESGTDSRGIRQARFRGLHLFSSKVFCAECNYSYTFYWCNQKKTVGAYKDSFQYKNNNPAKCCANTEYNKIYEKDLKALSLSAINLYIQENKEIFPLLIRILREVIKKTPDEESKIKMLEKRLASVKNKRDRCRERYIDEADPLLRTDLRNRYEELAKEVEELELQLDSMTDDSRENKLDDIEKRMADITAALEDIQHLKSIDKDIVEAFIKRIEITKDGCVNILLQGNRAIKNKTEPWKNRRQGKPTSDLFCEKASYDFPPEAYRNIVSIPDQEANDEHTVRLPLFRFEYVIINGEKHTKNSSVFIREERVNVPVTVTISCD